MGIFQAEKPKVLKEFPFTPWSRASSMRSVQTERSTQVPPGGTGFSRLFSRSRHWHGPDFIRSGRHPSTFLRPFAPRVLPRFGATMDALTPVPSARNRSPPREVAVGFMAHPQLGLNWASFLATGVNSPENIVREEPGPRLLKINFKLL